MVKANILLHNPQQVYKPGDTPHLQNHLDVQNDKTSTFSVFVGLYIMKYSQGPELRWYLCQLSAHQHENWIATNQRRAEGGAPLPAEISKAL